MVGIVSEMLVRIRTAADESLFRVRRLEMEVRERKDEGKR